MIEIAPAPNAANENHEKSVNRGECERESWRSRRSAGRANANYRRSGRNLKCNVVEHQKTWREREPFAPLPTLRAYPNNPLEPFGEETINCLWLNPA